MLSFIPRDLELASLCICIWLALLQTYACNSAAAGNVIPLKRLLLSITCSDSNAGAMHQAPLRAASMVLPAAAGIWYSLSLFYHIHGLAGCCRHVVLSVAGL